MGRGQAPLPAVSTLRSCGAMGAWTRPRAPASRRHPHPNALWQMDAIP